MSIPTCPSCIYAQGICKKTGVQIRITTGCTYHVPKPQATADRIRAMSDEELAAWVETIAGCDLCPMLDEQCSGGEVNSRASCKRHWLDYLRHEAEEGAKL